MPISDAQVERSEIMVDKKVAPSIWGEELESAREELLARYEPWDVCGHSSQKIDPRSLSPTLSRRVQRQRLSPRNEEVPSVRETQRVPPHPCIWMVVHDQVVW